MREIVKVLGLREIIQEMNNAKMRVPLELWVYLEVL